MFEASRSGSGFASLLAFSSRLARDIGLKGPAVELCANRGKPYNIGSLPSVQPRGLFRRGPLCPCDQHIRNALRTLAEYPISVTLCSSAKMIHSEEELQQYEPVLQDRAEDDEDDGDEEEEGGEEEGDVEGGGNDDEEGEVR